MKRITSALENLGQCESLDLKKAYDLGETKVRIPPEGVPIELLLGKAGQRLWLYPESLLSRGDPEQAPRDYLILDPVSFFSEISGFCRLGVGDTITLGTEDQKQSAIMRSADGVSRRHLMIKLTDKGLVFKNLAPDAGACLAPLTKEKKINKLWAWRRDKVKRLRKFLKEPLRPLSVDEAFALLNQVNQILAEEPCRPKNSLGRPGGVIELPKHLTPIIIGDLHTLLDNLLVILTQNQFLDALENKEACLVFLGDAVHCEIDGHMEEMDSSLEIMDFILNLKLRYPQHVFYLRGNHDGFSEDIGKGGVPQGMLWERHVRKTRGKSYLEALKTLYDRLPYLAYSDDFVACHAAAPVSKVSLQQLIDIHQNPKLIQEVMNNRLQKPNRPGGYTKTDVKRLRKALGLAADATFIVGHTPHTPDDTFWVDVGNIPNHCGVFGANLSWVGVMTRVGNRMTPLKYPAEALSALFTE